ncbi:hypothetical protein [Porphyrobacter sp. HT-58-2]|uniref:hypothetical protein n=1 Tax=Porphyrobacter sp. HT-58-2 TaxID=2023229 RepID=UPI0011B06DC4|nr:hypothetical protein [Porphyrobacter sp. HT-58-2]
MLDPSQCFAAPISAAGQITLVLPRSRYEHRCLIVMSGGKPFAVCLDELDQLGYFRAFECEENDAWKGLHIPGVQIELDETSLHDAEAFHTPLGSMVRSEDQLAIRVNLEGPRHVSSAPLVILDGLPPCAPHLTACFLKWQIVLGRGDDRQVLWTADLTPNGR